MELKIGNKKISNNHEVFIIAEIGVNHNGAMDLAKKLVHEAYYAGVDAVKFQMYYTDELVIENAELAEYQKKTGYTNQQVMLQQYQLDEKQMREVKQYCDQLGILFIATAADQRSASFLNQLEVPAFKVGSGDLTNLPLLKFIQKFQKPMILSTGMSTLSEIEYSLNHLSPTQEIALLHCTSSYPAPFEDLHLHAIHTLKNAFTKIIGYSDHSIGIEVPLAAVSLGYKIIEKHLTMDKTMEGPDHEASLEPQELRSMVKGIRNIESALGSTQKKVAPCEQYTKNIVRRSIYLKKDVKEGHILQWEDVGFLRPLQGIEACYYDKVIGKPLRISKKKGEPLFWNELS